MIEERKYKIVYCAPALYSAGGVERVVSLKASYFAEGIKLDGADTVLLREEYPVASGIVFFAGLIDFLFLA